MNRVTIYILGALLLAGGLAYGAFVLGVPPLWIGIGVLVLLGLGIMGAASNAKGSSKANVHIHEE